MTQSARADPQIIRRKVAQAQGLKRYFTGKPCIRGHVVWRPVSSGACSECSRELDRRQYVPVKPGPRKVAREQGLKRFFTGKPCLRGHVGARPVKTGHCMECDRERERKRYAADPEVGRKRRIRKEARRIRKEGGRNLTRYFTGGPTVADLLADAWAPRPWPEGYACIYKATLLGTTRAYVGKAVDLRDRFRRHVCGDEYIGRALNAHGPENFSIEILWIALTEADAYAQEDWFIEEHRTREAHGGFNLGEGGKGWTSEEASRAGILGNAIAGEVLARRAGYPQRRVLAELEKGPRTTASMVAALGLTMVQLHDAFHGLFRNGHLIIGGERGGLYRLVTFEEAADDWASGRALSNEGRVLGALMEGPHTVPELMTALGLTRAVAYTSIADLRERHNIVNRGARGNIPGTWHLVQDKRHPWLHLHAMDLRAAAWDDPTFSLQYRKE